MTSFAGQVLFESVIVPAVVSGLIVLPTRWLRHRVSLVLIYAAGFFAAIAASYVLTFGWPSTPALGARQEIAILATACLLIGIGLSLWKPRLLSLLTTLLVAGPLWIGWPLLMQGRSDAVLLALPLIMAPFIAGFWVNDRPAPSTFDAGERCILMVIMAIGLAMIALFARTLSITQLSLALASTLTAAALAGRKPPPILLIAGTAMLSGILTALLLYSEANVPAMFILSGILLLPALQRFFSGVSIIRGSPWPVYFAAIMLTAIAVSITWIDAGSISVY